MSNQEIVSYVAVIGAILLLTVVLTVAAVRLRKASDAEAQALRAAQVVAECKDLLPGPDFLWLVWHDTARAAEMQALIRNAGDEVVSTLSVPAVPTDGVLRRFDLAGTHYEVRKPSLMSNRTCLHEVGRNAVLFSVEHRTTSTVFFNGDGEAELFTVPHVSAWQRYRPIAVGEEVLGKVIVGLKRNSHVRILALPRERISLLAQVLVLASA